MTDAPESEPPNLPLAGLRVASFESRRSAESSRLIARQGGMTLEAPSLREVPVQGPGGADELFELLGGTEPVVLVLMTGVGTELLLEALTERTSADRARELFGSAKLICRGPKPLSALKPRGIRADLVVGEPNTWRDVIEAIDAGDEVRGRHVVVQEYGRTNDELLSALRARGPLSVRTVRPYEWALPEDLAPLHAAIERIIGGDIDIALFTSGVQVRHLLEVAARSNHERALRQQLSRVVIASVGPLTSEALLGAGIHPDIEPEHPKLGHLIRALAEQGSAAVARKRSAPLAS